MRWWWAATLAIWFVGIGGAAAAKAPGWLDYHARVLPNGLRVYTAPIASAAKVSVQVWYGVGSDDDPPGRAGLAHLFEHLMFKDSGRLAFGLLDQLTESAGGDSNASTARDFTEFDDTIPSWRLEAVLWAEASRMARLEVDQHDLDGERAVVERELREAAVEQDPVQTLTWDVPRGTVVVPAPFGRAGGSIQGLRGVTLEDVRRFHDVFYRPDNAVLVVSGAFDEAQLDDWIDRYFGVIQGRSAPTPHASRPKAPPALRPAGSQSQAKRATAVVLGFRGPAPTSADAPILDIIDALLTGDETTLGYRRLVAPGLASEVFSEVHLRTPSSVLLFGAIRSGRRTGGELERGLRASLAELRERVIHENTLTSIKNQLLADALQSRETVEGVGAELGEAAILTGDAGHVNTELAVLAGASPADIQRVARLYLRDDQAVPLKLRTTSAGPSEPVAFVPRAPDAAGRAKPPGPAVFRPSLQGATPSLPPAPSVVEKVLPNGLRVVVASGSRLPLASAVLLASTASATDARTSRNLSQLAADVALFGCTGSAHETTAFADLGLSATTRIDPGAVRLSVSGLASTMPEGLRRLARCVRAPPPASASFKRLRRELVDGSLHDVDDVELVAEAALDRFAVGRASRARRDGAAMGAQGLTRARVQQRRDQLFRPDRVVLAITGDVASDRALALAADLFGDWRVAASSPPEKAAHASYSPPCRLLIADAPGYPLALVTLAARISRADEAQRLPFEIASGVLGGSFTSRLSQVLRAQRSLTYDVSSRIDWAHAGGRLIAMTEVDPSAGAEAARLMIGELRDLAATGPTAAELQKEKAQFAAQLVDASETTEDLADLLAEKASRHEPAGEVFAAARGLSGVTASDVQAAAARLAHAGNLTVVIVADVRRLPKSLIQRVPSSSIIKATALISPRN